MHERFPLRIRSFVLAVFSVTGFNTVKEYILIRLSRIQLKFREFSSCFILETDFTFEFLVRKYACVENFKYIRQRESHKIQLLKFVC